VVSGWQVGWSYKFQSGISPTWAGYTRAGLFYYGDVTKIAQRLNTQKVHAQDIHLWFDPTATYRTNTTAPIPSDFVGFEGRSAFQPAYNVLTFPIRFTDVRADPLRGWSANIKREFRLTERVKIRFNVDFLNATNHTNFGNPTLTVTSSNFGRVTSQAGTGRMIQFNLRVQF
jgi:hypothetical protein